MAQTIETLAARLANIQINEHSTTERILRISQLEYRHKASFPCLGRRLVDKNTAARLERESFFREIFNICASQGLDAGEVFITANKANREKLMQINAKIALIMQDFAFCDYVRQTFIK